MESTLPPYFRPQRRYPNIYTLQRVLGHSSLDTVRIYLEIAEVDIHLAHRTASVADAWRL